MKRNRPASVLFLVAAIYDGVLGAAFLCAASSLFSWFRVEPPNHLAYVQFPAALLMVFALMFLSIARDPYANRNLVPYGMLLKVSYCAVALFHWLETGIPTMWKPFVILDLAFLLLFAWAYLSLGKSASSE